MAVSLSDNFNIQVSLAPTPTVSQPDLEAAGFEHAYGAPGTKL